MTLNQAISKSKIRLLLVSFNVNDSDSLPISRKQARALFADYLKVQDEFEKGVFEENNIFATYEDNGILYLGG